MAGLLVGTLPLLAGGAAYTLLRRSLPRLDGTLRLPGLTAPVEVLRDRWGIPHVYAQSNADLFAAQGYLHAQDRLWQMELQRRTGLGQLAELFGEIALESDRFIRILGFGRVARQEAATLSPEAHEATAAYCRGVNAFLETHRRHLPIEFTILRHEPRPWEPTDLLAWGKVMALNLSENWTAEILRAQIVAAIGNAAAIRFDWTYPTEHPLTIPAGADYSPTLGDAALRRLEETTRFTGGHELQGSNAWVVAGSRTVTGRPLLANDPHLALQLPSLWYEMHLVGGDYAVAGATIPGATGVIIGHNERIAWGVTNGMTDVQDLYIERFDPADPTGRRYQFRDGWTEATLVDEAIAIRDRPRSQHQRTETVTVRITHHGPVINDLLPGDATTNGQHDRALALRWTALDPGTLQDAILRLNRAEDWASFRTALAAWTVPPQNFVYADTDGRIGYALGGDIPVRAQGDGRLPVPGWSGEWEWLGTIPPAENPHLLDPPDAFIANANNRIVDDRYHYPLPGEWLPGYRAARIAEVLGRSTRHDVDSFARLQTDRYSRPGLACVALAQADRLPLDERDRVALDARDCLAAWDGLLTADSIGGLIATTLQQELLRRAHLPLAESLETVTGLGVFASAPGRIYLERALPRVLALVAGEVGDWSASGDAAELLAYAWRATVARLRQEWGDDVSRWRYGAAHRLTLRHALGALGPLARLFNRGPYAMGGDLNTLCMGHAAISPTGIASYTGPSYRQICDLSDWDRGRAIYPGGQSGHPLSPHYDDYLKAWLTERYHPLLWTRPAIERASRHHLTLTPA